MKIKFITIGKNSDSKIESLIERYLTRLTHYVKFENLCLSDVKLSKNDSVERQKELEWRAILDVLEISDFVILLDERGKEYTSRGFADMLDNHQIRGTRTVVFIVGGPFGFSDTVYKRANHMLALSQMTLTHEMIRLFFVEQVYRAFTLIRGEGYHH